MITFQEKIFNENNEYFTFEKFFEESKTTLWCKVRIGNNNFTDYQLDIFQEFLSEFVEYLQSDDIFFDDIRSFFEKRLQLLNSKLSAFSEKMENEEHYDLSWVMHLIVSDQYISSLIWSSSLLIFRDWVLVYSVNNEPSPGKIDLFSDVIEWDLEDEDKIIVRGTQIDTYLDQDDLKMITSISQDNEISFVQQLLDIVLVRADADKLWFYQDIDFSTWKTITQKKLKRWFGSSIKVLSSRLWSLKEYSKILTYWIWWLFVLMLFYRTLSGFLLDNGTVIKDSNWDVLIDFWIDDIQQDIAIFKQLKPSSSEKVKKYNEIIHRLDLLEQNNLRVYDVTELRSILDQDYKEWFNIKLINSTELLWEPVYEFSSQEKNTMWAMSQVFYRNGFHVWWEDWVLIWAINETIRGSLVSSAIWQKLEACNLNLLKNWLLCSSSDGTVYNTDKNWFTPVVTDDRKFPRAIKGIWTWWSSNMYILTNDERMNNEWTYIIKYQNKTWSQNELWESTKYVIKDTFNTDNNFPFASWTASFTIDWTFLVWSSWQKKLFQMFREWTSDVMIWRELPLLWWDTLSNPFSENTKIIATAESRYIYLFDAEQQQFVVYRSSPYKTTPWGEREWNPDYAFMIKFDLSEEYWIIDAFVEEWEKSNIFLLTKNNVFKIPLHEYIAQYIEDQEE